MSTSGTPNLVGTSVNRFVVVQEIGPVRRGIEYRAMDPEQNSRLVSLIVVGREGSSASADGRLTNPFVREVKLAAELHHPSIAQVYGTGQLDSEHWWIAAEVLDGMSLREELDHKERFAWPLALELITLAAEAVGVLHDKQVVHRNLCLECLVSRVSKAGVLKVKVQDYGLAKYAHERDDAEAGVPPLGICPPWYMAPETAGGGGTGYRSDVWALAAIALELMTGDPILPSRQAPEAALEHLAGGEPVPAWELRELCPEVPAAVAEYLLGCLARDPRDRPRDAVAFVAGLERANERVEAGEPEEEGGLLSAVGSLFRRRDAGS